MLKIVLDDAEPLAHRRHNGLGYDRLKVDGKLDTCGGSLRIRRVLNANQLVVRQRDRQRRGRWERGGARGPVENLQATLRHLHMPYKTLEYRFLIPCRLPLQNPQNPIPAELLHKRMNRRKTILQNLLEDVYNLPVLLR
jgi:hypothetical protein